MKTTLPDRSDCIENFTSHRRARTQQAEETKIFAIRISETVAAIRLAIAEHGADSWQVANLSVELGALSTGLDTLTSWGNKLAERERATRLRVAAQQKAHAARMRARAGIACRARTHRHTRSHRVVRVAAKPAAKSNADPDSSSDGDSTGARQIGGAL